MVRASFSLLLVHSLTLVTMARDTSIFDSVTNRPGGVVCRDNSQCYSRICYVEGYCAPDAPLEGTTTGGSPCTINADCFSNYCFETICAPDSKVKGKVAAGGPCVLHEQCFSGYCNLRRCGSDSEAVGKLAAGAECEYNSQCFSGYCHRSPGPGSMPRCAPDGRDEGKSPGGGYCRNDEHCASGSCHNQRCAPESQNERGKTMDGGPCRNHSYCENRHRCYLELCIPRDLNRLILRPEPFDPKEYKNARTMDVDAKKARQLPVGARCTKNAECENSLCVFDRCVPLGLFDQSTIADGGMCNEQIQDGQCQSGHCRDHICTVSYPGRSKIRAGAAGSPCLDHRYCYSGYCSGNKCSADSPTTPLEVQLEAQNRYQVAGGGVCEKNEDCYSAYCDNKRCGSDGPRRYTLASGSMCQGDEQCYSKYCYKNRCAPSAGGDQEGKVAAGGQCLGDPSCPVGCSCKQGYCHLEKIVYGSNVRDLLRPMMASVKANESCWHNAQCAVGRCLERRCTVRLTDEIYRSGSGNLRSGFSVLSACVTTVLIGLMLL